MARHDGNLVKALYVLLALAAVTIWLFIGGMMAVHLDHSVEGPEGRSYHQLKLEDEPERSVIQVSGMGMEPPSSIADTVVVVGCFISSIMIIGTILLSDARKESRDDKEGSKK